METQNARSGRMLSGLLAASHLMPLEDLPDTVNERAADVGFDRVLIYLGDLQRGVLRLLTGEGLDAHRDSGGAEAELKVEGTVAGRSYQLGRVLPALPGGRGRWWVPLVDGAERLGVLYVMTAGPGDDARTRQDMTDLAALTALIIGSKQGSSDSYARLTRSRPMNIAAEMQWHLMPPRTYADGRVVVAGALEPAYTTSGDAYDYAMAGPVVHLSLFDAMGHDTGAGVTANLAMGTCRATRRRGGSLVEIGDAIERAIVDQFRHTRYATGILADLDTRDGTFSWVNRGHLPPLILRGGRWVTRLRCPPSHPMGTGLGLPSTVCREQLQPGDRIVLYTDGITEARRPDGSEFGLDRFTEFLIRHHADDLPVPETLRRLIGAVLDYHGGELGDDATVLLCQWLGPGSRATAGTAALAGIPGN
jgi:hypothetical protein